MQVFEHKFNTNIDKDIKLRTFSFKPNEANKLHLGDLFILAEEINYLPSDQTLLDDLANVIKEEFYSNHERQAEVSFKEALRKGNIFLAKKAESGDINWLGNLNIAVLNFGNFLLNFARVGTIRIILSRSDELKDLGQEIETHGTGSATKFFSNISTGRLMLNDKVILSTQQLFEQLYDYVLPEMIGLTEVNEKNIKNIFLDNKSEAKNWSGIFILAFVKRKKLQFSLPFKINRLIILFFLLIITLLISFFIFKK
jgi:hypothetical protein